MNTSLRGIRTWSIGAKLSLAIFSLVSFLFVAFVAVINYNISHRVEVQTTQDVVERTKIVAKILEGFDQDQRSQIQIFTRVFKNDLIGQFQVDESKVVDVVGTPTPTLLLNGNPLNMDFKSVDQFEIQTGGIATIFVQSGDDFLRISTSLKKENGERAIGTKLDRNGAAYKQLINGQSYIGNATLFGKQYITEYDPIKTSDGKIIGVLFVGLDFTEAVKKLQDQIRALKIGETGYFYALNAKEGDQYGVLMIHPSKEGQSILDAKDSSGHEFIKEILQRKQGVIKYPWINKERGETSSREKIVAFQAIENWNWIIAGGVYTDEYTQESTRFMLIVDFFALTLLLILGVLLYYTMRQRLSQPLQQVTEAATRLAQGDLTTSLAVNRFDEIGQLMVAMNNIGVGLTTMVHQVRESTALIAHSSKEIAQGNADLSARTESQASSLEETAASMHELTGTVKENSDSAANANSLVVTTADIAAKGGAVVAKVTEMMGSIQDSSRRIVDIISVIDGIAFQTNILALNAAVEAARAGEQGRGFAVVASEVRSLAQRSASAAKEIKNLIDDSVRKVDDGNILVNETGKTMNEIVDSVGRVTQIISEISLASREQSSGIEQINQAVAQMDEMTQQNAHVVEQAAIGAKEMERQADQLVEAVSVFKVARRVD